MTKIVGLTGGIGSGKTWVANYFKFLGIPVFFSDDEAKKIMLSADVVDLIRSAFGEDVIIKKNIVNRQKLSQIVFNDSLKLEALNAIIHPRVKKQFDIWIDKHKEFEFVVKETAILFETGGQSLCDYNILVTAPTETRITRVMERDKTDRLSVINIMKNQWSDEDKIKKSDFIIENTDFENTKLQILEIVKKLNNQ